MSESRGYRLNLFILIILGVVSNSVLSQSFSEASVKEEILVLWNDYLTALKEGRLDYIANSVYQAPNYFLAPDGSMLNQTSSDTAISFNNTLENLEESNYDNTVTTSMTICVMNPMTAILSAKYDRYDIDGSVLSENAGTYVFGLFAEGWRITTATFHSPEKVIKCAD